VDPVSVTVKHISRLDPDHNGTSRADALNPNTISVPPRFKQLSNPENDSYQRGCRIRITVRKDGNTFLSHWTDRSPSSNSTERNSTDHILLPYLQALNFLYPGATRLRFQLCITWSRPMISLTEMIASASSFSLPITPLMPSALEWSTSPNRRLRASTRPHRVPGASGAVGQERARQASFLCVGAHGSHAIM